MNEDKYLTIKDSVLVRCSNKATIISVPKNVTIIDEYAFWGCNNLQEVNIPNVSIIKDYAFRDCGSLQKVNILNDLKFIGNHAFENCVNLLEISIPPTCETIGDYAFADCPNLKKASISGNIGNFAFKNCLSLREITIENSIKYIGENIFYNCYKLKKININKYVNFINLDIFIELKHIENISLHKENMSFVSIDGVLFNKDKSILLKCPINKKNITIFYGIKTIGNGAFRNCKSLEEIKFPTNIKDEDDNNLRYIGNNAFEGCKKLKGIEIPSSVEYIGKSAFKNCSNIEKINYEFDKAFIYEKKRGVYSYYILTIDDYAFAECENLKNVEFYNLAYSDEYGTDILAKLYIGKYTFSNCENLQQVNFYTPLEAYEINIDDYAFLNCENLKSVHKPYFNAYYGKEDIIDFIGNGAFKNCINLEYIPLGENIGTNAFYGCEKLHNVVNYSIIDDNNLYNSLEPTLFKVINCIDKITITDDVEIIRYDAFNDCVDLEEITVESGNNNYFSIDGVLYNKDGTILVKCPQQKKKISIPKYVEHIDKNAFYGCENLEEINVENGNKYYHYINGVLYFNNKPILIKGDKINDFMYINHWYSPKSENLIRKIFASSNIDLYYSIVDGVLYNIDETSIIGASKDKKEIIIPSKVENICFDKGHLNNLEKIIVERGNEKYSSFDGALYNKDMTKLIKCPSNKKEIIIPDSVNTIEESAFESCKNLEEIFIPYSVNHIGIYAFYNLENLKKIKAPKKLYWRGTYSNWYYFYKDDDYYYYDDYYDNYYDDYYDQYNVYDPYFQNYYDDGDYFTGAHRYKYRYSGDYFDYFRNENKKPYGQENNYLSGGEVPENCVLELY